MTFEDNNQHMMNVLIKNKLMAARGHPEDCWYISQHANMSCTSAASLTLTCTCSRYPGTTPAQNWDASRALRDTHPQYGQLCNKIHTKTNKIKLVQKFEAGAQKLCSGRVVRYYLSSLYRECLAWARHMA